MKELWIKRAGKAEEWYHNWVGVEDLTNKEVAKKEKVRHLVKLQKYTIANISRGVKDWLRF